MYMFTLTAHSSERVLLLPYPALPCFHNFPGELATTTAQFLCETRWKLSSVFDYDMTNQKTYNCQIQLFYSTTEALFAGGFEGRLNET